MSGRGGWDALASEHQTLRVDGCRFPNSVTYRQGKLRRSFNLSLDLVNLVPTTTRSHKNYTFNRLEVAVGYIGTNDPRYLPRQT